MQPTILLPYPVFARVARWTLGAVMCTALVACGGGDDDPAPVYQPRAGASTVPAATVTGPVAVSTAFATTQIDPTHDYPQLATPLNLAARGYVEEEFFIDGTASRYNTPAQTTGSVISSDHAYRSRLLVRRPASPAAFNGKVIVEWVNVTSGYNLDALWQSSAEHFMRSGYAYVGVSAQRVGIHQAVTGLKAWGAARYATLDVTAGGTIVDDSLSYDVFAQAAKAVGRPGAVDPLGGLGANRMLIAAGVSQSEGRLVAYYNSIEPLHRLFDGYFMFLGVGGQFRTDLDVKVFKINTENDVLLLGEGAARQPDSDRLRTWEVTGASHVSYQSTLVRGPILARDGLPSSSTTCDLPSLSHVPVGHTLMPAYDHLVRWVADGTAPPTAPRITLTTVGPPSVATEDAQGNALGGLRLAAMAVPTAKQTGFNSGAGFCRLFGSYEPFDAVTLSALYTSNTDYVNQVRAAVDANVAAGYLLRPEADATIAEAQASGIGD